MLLYYSSEAPGDPFWIDWITYFVGEDVAKTLPGRSCLQSPLRLLPPNPPQDSCGLIAQRDLPSAALGDEACLQPVPCP